MSSRRLQDAFVKKNVCWATLINSVRAILTDFQEKDRIKLMSLQASLSDKIHLLQNLNQQILSLIEDEDKIGTDIDRSSEADLTIKECLFEIQAVLSKRTIIHRQVMTLLTI